MQHSDFHKILSGDTSFELSYGDYFKYVGESDARLSGKPLPTLFQPMVLTRDTFSGLREDAEQMSSILSKVSDLYVNYEEVRQFFNFPEILQQWIEIDPGYDMAIPISRYDAFQTGTKLRFCEFNTDGTSGMTEIYTLDNAFLQTQSGKNLAKKCCLEGLDLIGPLLDTILTNYKSFGGKGIPNVAIMDFSESATMTEFEILKNEFFARKVPADICDPRELRFSGGRLWHNNFKIDVIYRRAVTDEMFTQRDKIGDLLQAYKEGAVCMVGPLRSQIAHSKLIFPFLCADFSERYFSDQEKQYVRSHIPWTSRLTDDIAGTIIGDQDKYYLKPHDSYGSKGVYFGEDYSSDEWEKIVRKIIESNDNYLVQESISIPQGEFLIDAEGGTNTFNIQLSPFVFNGRLSGFYTRISDINIITTNKGARLLPLFCCGKELELR